VRYILWFSQTKGTSPPLFLSVITLITYLLSSYSYSCLVLPWLAIDYLSLHLTALRLLTYQQPVCLFVWPLFSAVVRVSRTEGESVWSKVRHTQSLSTVPGPGCRDQASSQHNAHSPAKGPISAREFVLQPFYLPPVPVVVETINPTAFLFLARLTGVVACLYPL
jgi:hypothetical protein